MDYKNKIIELKDQEDTRRTTRKVFLSYPTAALVDDIDLEFEITDLICDFFSSNIRNILICGSAKLGYSPFKNTDFSVGKSDLDVAIIDVQVFQTYHEIASRSTKYFSDLTGFKNIKIANKFEKYLVKGIINLSVFPNCKERTIYNSFFEDISSKFSKKFSKISVFIYMNYYVFEEKQLPSIQETMKRG